MKRTKRKCPECGTEFFGTTGSVLCPACQKSKIVSSTIRERTCIICGRTFDGGPRAKRCPECRILVRKENAAKYRKSGPMRPLGSIDCCKRCGKEYVVRTGRQKYCSDKCAQISVKEWQSEHKKTKYNPEKAEIRPEIPLGKTGCRRYIDRSRFLTMAIGKKREDNRKQAEYEEYK